VANVSEFTDALLRVAGGGTALDPEVVSQLMRPSQGGAALGALTGREREVLSLMAEGRSNGAIARALELSASAVDKHVSSIFAKLRLPESGDDHRRVRAVLRYLRG
jgi:DNA-binding NarL/FixJ family response regulator